MSNPPTASASATTAPRMSTDQKYLHHEFTTFAGGQHWSAGWTAEEAREAVDAHLSGYFFRSAILARDVVRYAPIMGALRQRMAPALRTKWRVEGPTRAPGRFATEDIAAVWLDFRRLYGELLRDLALMGFAWVHHHMAIDERGLEVPVLKRWPMEAVNWCGATPAWPAGYYASTLDSGLVRMVDGDGHWTMIGNGERPHEMGAILALGLSYVAGETSRRDRANLSAAAGRASPIATLPSGVAVDSDEGKTVAKVVAGLGRARVGAVIPNGTTIQPFSISSDTNFFNDALKDELQMVAFALLGQSGTMAQGSGGVYTAPVFEGVLEALIDSDIEATERGFNGGLAKPVTAINYPGVEAPRLVDERPDRDEHARAKALGERAATFNDIVAKEKANGFLVDQERVDLLADEMSVPAPKLAPPANDVADEPPPAA